jgi:sugar/nucleoside kinase (ribokinase family)
MTLNEKLKSNGKLVVGVGSALIDILAHENDAFLERTGAVKGGMTYVDKDFIDHTVGLATLTPAVVPGGSACNTTVGIGRLGGQARFVGKCGNGPMGQLFRSDLERRNVAPWLFDSDAPTGRVLSIITPDAERSMFTFLGASAQIQPAEITPDCFRPAAVVHVEGYLLFNRNVIWAILKAAKQIGAVISLDLASFNVVAEAADILTDLVAEYVDILIANEDEAFAYTKERSESKALEAMARNVEIAVLKLGARGSLIAQNGCRMTVAPWGSGKAVDTTGAGDLWAAGFLYGLVHGLPLARCGDLGSRLGYEVCQVVGADIPDERWNDIRKGLENDGQKALNT